MRVVFQFFFWFMSFGGEGSLSERFENAGLYRTRICERSRKLRQVREETVGLNVECAYTSRNM